MTIGELMSVIQEPVVIQQLTEHSVRTMVDTRKTEGEIPFDLVDKTVYQVYVDASDFYADQLALTIEYEEV